MSFEKIMEQLMLENANESLEKVFGSMFETIKSMGDATITTLFPAATPEMRHQILETAWKNALFKAYIDASCKRSTTHKLSREEFLALFNEEDAVNLSPNKPSQFPMTKEEFLSLTKDELNALPTNDVESDFYDASEYRHIERAEQSLLNKYGYNVSRESNMSSRQRQELLAHLISTHKVSKSKVINHLEYLIKINGKKETNEIAAAKWKADLEFVRNMN